MAAEPRVPDARAVADEVRRAFRLSAIGLPHASGGGLSTVLELEVIQ
jgi:hypothetical protein